jgi:ribosomal protein S18 acetylase RimI-like enzyme
MIIRELQNSDKLIDLYDRCFIEAHQKIIPSYISINTLKTKAIENFKNTVHSGDAKVFVAEKNNQILGFIVLKPKNGEIVSLYVIPEQQRRGIASALVSRALAEFSLLGIEKVFLSVFELNHPAIALYQKLGFKEEQNANRQVLNINLIQFTKEIKSR